ncbi:MAG: ATP-binding cassette domain-containing protein [Burkholderiales bacterium]|nr:ATP-binding cassette domain-containing protein [Burkholderiales bacterium]
MSQPLLEVEGVVRRLGGRRVLDGVRLNLARGQCCVLSGDNGSGKTTLLRILSGLEAADAGMLRFQGVQTRLPGYPDDWRLRVVYVHQHPYLFHSSVAGNIAYGLKARGEPRETWRQKVEEAIDWAGVRDVVAVPPQKLSGGEKQRVAMARAKVLSPQLLLLDEPTANLDADGRRRTMELLARLFAEGVSVLIACHDRELIELPGVQRLHLENGKLL